MLQNLRALRHRNRLRVGDRRHGEKLVGRVSDKYFATDEKLSFASHCVVNLNVSSACLCVHSHGPIS